MDRLKVSTKEENSANCIISHSWELLKQSRLKIGCQGWIAWVRVSEILIVSFPPFIEDFVSYSWKIVVYQKHLLFSCVESFQVLRTVSVSFCASMILWQCNQKTLRMRRVNLSVCLSHHGGLRRASYQPKDPFWEQKDQMRMFFWRKGNKTVYFENNILTTWGLMKAPGLFANRSTFAFSYSCYSFVLDN